MSKEKLGRKKKIDRELTYSVVLDDRAVFTQNQTLGSISEVCKTTDRKVFMVEVRSVAKDFVGLCEARRLAEELCYRPIRHR